LGLARLGLAPMGLASVGPRLLSAVVGARLVLLPPLPMWTVVMKPISPYLGRGS
jgi:hypothetical protein